MLHFDVECGTDCHQIAKVATGLGDADAGGVAALPRNDGAVSLNPPAGIGMNHGWTQIDTDEDRKSELSQPTATGRQLAVGDLLSSAGSRVREPARTVSRADVLRADFCESGTGGWETDGDIKLLTSDTCDHLYPEWNPRGDSLIYQVDEEASGYTQAYLIPARGGAEVQVTSDNANHNWPSWLSDHEIVYQWSPDTGYDQIAKYDLDSSQQTVLTSSENDHEKPSPAPFGAVAYTVIDDAGDYQVGRVSASGDSEQVLTTGWYDHEEVVWSDDSVSIYCVKWLGLTSEIGMVHADSGGYEALTDGSAIRDNPDAYWDQRSETNTVAFEREDTTGADGWGPRRRRRPGAGIFGVRTGRARGGGPMAGELGRIALHRAVPNPAADRVRIRWQVPVQCRATLRVYDTAGRLVNVLVDGPVEPGVHETMWDGTDSKGRRLATGVYFYTLDTEQKRLNRKVVLTR